MTVELDDVADRLCGADLRRRREPIAKSQFPRSQFLRCFFANAGAAMMDAIHKLVEINNQFYPGSPLSFSMGAATSRPGERLEAAARRAVLVMFEAKRKHYAQPLDSRAREPASAA
jgi:hypothetical protein